MSWDVLVVLGSTDGTIAAGTEVQGLVLNDVIVNHGRRSVNDQPDASSATFGFLWELDDTVMPSAGTRIQLWVEVNGGAYPFCLFDGNVTDLVITEHVLSVIAVSRPLADAGRQTIGNPSTITSTTASALATVYALGDQDDRIGTMTGSTDVRIADFASENLLGLMREIAASEIGGYLTESMPWGPTSAGYTDGPRVINRTQADRASTTSYDITFTGDEILDSWQYSIRADDTVNIVRVLGTEDPTDFPTGEAIVSNAYSIDGVGANQRDVPTRNRYQADAEAIAQDIVDRYATNVWKIESITVLFGAMTDARMFTVMDALNPDARVRIPAPFRFATSAYYVEGITFTVARHNIEAQLFLSDTRFTQGPQTWKDIGSSDWTWAGWLGYPDFIPADLTWSGLRTYYIRETPIPSPPS